jgi:hypothetical protein
MFEGWDSFFLLVGGAGGGLIGLLFVVVTLVQGTDARSKLRASSIYMAPIVFHLAAVLVLSAIADAPLALMVQDAAIGAAALVGLGFSVRAVIMLGPSKTFTPSHWTDIWAYGVLPLIAYLPLVAAAAEIWIAPRWAAPCMAASLIALLLLAIRNAWDLVTWISARGDSLDAPAEPGR